MTEAVNIETDYVERFSRKNPPPSKEIALETIDEVTEANSSIESQLQFKSATDFSTTDAYRVWKDKAITALAYSRNELRFLEKWLSVCDIGIEMGLPVFNTPIAIRPVTLTKNTLRMLQQDVIAKARAIAGEIQSSLDQEPEKPSDKLLFFRKVMVRIEEALISVAMAGTNAQMSRNQIKIAKNPLSAIKQKTSSKITVTKNEVPQSIGYSWKEVCVSALSRAEAAGFVLLDVEKETLQKMKEWL